MVALGDLGLSLFRSRLRESFRLGSTVRRGPREGLSCDVQHPGGRGVRFPGHQDPDPSCPLRAPYSSPVRGSGSALEKVVRTRSAPLSLLCLVPSSTTSFVHRRRRAVHPRSKCRVHGVGTEGRLCPGYPRRVATTRVLPEVDVEDGPGGRGPVSRVHDVSILVSPLVTVHP